MFASTSLSARDLFGTHASYVLAANCSLNDGINFCGAWESEHTHKC